MLAVRGSFPQTERFYVGHQPHMLLGLGIDKWKSTDN